MDTSNNNFLKIALAARERGFTWVIPVHDKVPVKKSWLTINGTRTQTELNLMAHEFPTASVGIVLKGHAGSVFVWDIDKDGVIARMEKETGRKLPQTYIVQSRPTTAPFKQHVYFFQSNHFASVFPKQVNCGDYDLKGMGGGQVVAEGDVRRDTGEIRIGNSLPVLEIPDWLTDWLAKDSKPLVAAKREDQRKIQRAIALKSRHMGELVTPGHRTHYLQGVASRLLEIGLPKDYIERGLKLLTREFIENGSVWLKTTEGKKKVRSIAKNAKKRFKRLPVINPVYTRPSGLKIQDVTTDSKRKREFQALVTTAKTLPDSLTSAAAYLSLKLDAGSRSHQHKLHRAMTQAGFKFIDRQWVKNDQWVAPVGSELGHPRQKRPPQGSEAIPRQEREA